MIKWKNPLFLKKIVPSIPVNFNKVNSEHNKNVSPYTNNSKYTDAWDVRFKQIIDSCILSDIPYIVFDRGALWSGVMVLDSDTGNLYTFFNEKRFKEIIGSDKVFCNHYLEGILSFNDDLNIFGSHQMDLISDDQRDKKRIEMAHKLLGDNFDKVKRSIPITFELSGMKIIDVNEYLCNGYGDIIDRDNISYLLQTEVSQLEVNDKYPVDKRIVSLKRDVNKESKSISKIKIDKSMQKK